MFSLEALFCHVDDFCKVFEGQWYRTLLKHGGIKQVRAKSLCLSEIMTIANAFHQNHYRSFKHFYLKHCFGKYTGIGFADSTSLKVCHNHRISRNKVFKDFAARGKTSVDWFFGFKLHIVINELGEILNVILTPGNIDDRKLIPDLLKDLFGKIFADRGYVSKQLADKLFKEFGIEFFAKPRRNMKNKLMRLYDKLLSRKRSIIETINDQLKNISQIEHSRHLRES